MLISFAAALAQLAAGAVGRLANQARPPANYLFATLLPEMEREDYTAKSGTMTVRATMAGLVGMDSVYPPSGQVEATTFRESVAKMATNATLTEETLREIQTLLMRLQLNGGNTVEALQREGLNFLDKVVLQAHLDTMEWLRGQALVNGAINWTFGGITLDVNYGVPSANVLANRTGTAAYGGSASVFWSDVRSLQQALKRNVRAFIVHPDTLDVILDNDANAIEVLGDTNNTFEVRRYRTVGGNTVPSSDARERVQLIAYGESGSIIDPANPGATIDIPFMPRGKILAVGNNLATAYRVGMGGAEEIENTLGYTHLAPTVEGDGTPGRWARLRTPDDRPWQLVGEGVTNGLPVIEAAMKVAVASTDMP